MSQRAEFHFGRVRTELNEIRETRLVARYVSVFGVSFIAFLGRRRINACSAVDLPREFYILLWSDVSLVTVGCSVVRVYSRERIIVVEILDFEYFLEVCIVNVCLEISWNCYFRLGAIVGCIIHIGDCSVI